MKSTDPVLLIRTTRPTQALSEYARELQEAARARVMMLVDGRRFESRELRDGCMLMDFAAYKSLGLYTPADVGWRCGDYGLYAARKAFPDASSYWMLEDDLRIDGNVSQFFQFFAGKPEVDFLTTRLAPARHDWHWYPHSRARNATAYSCLFGITRSSGRAVDAFYAARRRHSRQPNRRLLWPNDESLCATTAHTGGLEARDINSFGRVFYDDDGYSLTGASKQLGSPHASPMLLHPVYVEVEGARGAASVQRYNQPASRAFRLRRAAIKRVNAVMSW